MKKIINWFFIKVMKFPEKLVDIKNWKLSTQYEPITMAVGFPVLYHFDDYNGHYFSTKPIYFYCNGCILETTQQNVMIDEGGFRFRDEPPVFKKNFPTKLLMWYLKRQNRFNVVS